MPATVIPPKSASILKQSNEPTIPRHQTKLLEQTSLLGQFEDDIACAGLVGEKQNAKIVFLAALSAALPRPLNVSVGGESSSGKNHLTGTVAKFLPEERKKILTGMSPKVLMYAAEDEFEHKAVFIAEYEGVSGADYAIRTMQSEQVIEWEFVDSSTSGLRKKKNTVRGPAAFIQATTRVTLHPENETRLLFLRIDESEKQTREINGRQAVEASGDGFPLPKDLLDGWHGFIRSLKTAQVRITYAPQLALFFPPDRVRSRRDFPKLLGLIEAVAYLHQNHRPIDDEGRIIAAPQDYLEAKELFEHCYFAGPETAIGEMLRAIGTLRRGTEFQAADVILKTGWKKSKSYEVLKRAEELGCVAEGSHRGWYILLRQHEETPLTLPAKIWLDASVSPHFRISTGKPN